MRRQGFRFSDEALRAMAAGDPIPKPSRAFVKPLDRVRSKVTKSGGVSATVEKGVTSGRGVGHAHPTGAPKLDDQRPKDDALVLAVTEGCRVSKPPRPGAETVGAHSKGDQTPVVTTAAAGFSHGGSSAVGGALPGTAPTGGRGDVGSDAGLVLGELPGFSSAAGGSPVDRSGKASASPSTSRPQLAFVNSGSETPSVGVAHNTPSLGVIEVGSFTAPPLNPEVNCSAKAVHGSAGVSRYNNGANVNPGSGNNVSPVNQSDFSIRNLTKPSTANQAKPKRGKCLPFFAKGKSLHVSSVSRFKNNVKALNGILRQNLQSVLRENSVAQAVAKPNLPISHGNVSAAPVQARTLDQNTTSAHTLPQNRRRGPNQSHSARTNASFFAKSFTDNRSNFANMNNDLNNLTNGFARVGVNVTSAGNSRPHPFTGVSSANGASIGPHLNSYFAGLFSASLNDAHALDNSGFMQAPTISEKIVEIHRGEPCITFDDCEVQQMNASSGLTLLRPLLGSTRPGGEDVGFWQPIEYEKVTRYCLTCRKQGHSAHECRSVGVGISPNGGAMQLPQGPLRPKFVFACSSGAGSAKSQPSGPVPTPQSRVVRQPIAQGQGVSTGAKEILYLYESWHDSPKL
nr:ABC transporter F family member 4-like [Ipomoea batatas]